MQAPHVCRTIIFTFEHISDSYEISVEKEKKRKITYRDLSPHISCEWVEEVASEY
jgi:hypothetical protein